MKHSKPFKSPRYVKNKKGGIQAAKPDPKILVESLVEFFTDCMKAEIEKKKALNDTLRGFMRKMHENSDVSKGHMDLTPHLA